MALITEDTSAGAMWFKPVDMKDAKAFLVEPSKVDMDVPNTKYGGTRNIATATLTVFRNREELDGTAEPTVFTNAKITGTALAGDLKDYVGDALVRKLAFMPPRDGRSGYWVWRGVDQSVAERVAAYYEGREAALDEELPDYLKG